MSPTPEGPGGFRRTPRLVLAFTLVFPTAAAAAEFLTAPPGGAGPGPAPVIYGAGKAVQLLLPVVCLAAFERRLPRPVRPRWRGLVLGLGFGLVVAAGALGLYFGFLRDTALFARSAAQMHGKLAEFGLDSPGGFAVFALFTSVLHSLLEEYYWRWFVFGRLARWVALPTAIFLSAVAFMVPHWFALATFLTGQNLAALAGFTLCVGAGGAAWAWLYHASGALYAPWLSHFVVDAALFAVGYDLFFVRPGG